MMSEKVKDKNVQNEGQDQKGKLISKSYRIYESTQDDIAKLADEHSLTMSALFDEFICLFRMQHAHEDFPGRSDDIVGFRNAMDAIEGYFLHLLQHASNVRATTLQESAASQDALQKTITELQLRVSEKESEIAEKEKTITELQQQVTELQSTIEQNRMELTSRDATIASLRDNRELLEMLKGMLVKDVNGAVAVNPTLFDDDNADASADDAQKSLKKSHGAS